MMAANANTISAGHITDMAPSRNIEWLNTKAAKQKKTEQQAERKKQEKGYKHA